MTWRGWGLVNGSYDDPTNENLMWLPPEPGTGSAVFSPCGRYRYLLARRVAVGTIDPVPVFIGYNPSKAGAVVQDATIRKETAYVRRWNAYGFVKVNAFAWIETEASELAFAEDPIGPLNDDVLARVRRAVDAGVLGPVVVAWGAFDQPFALKRFGDLLRGPLAGLQLYAFGTCKSGAPEHPLRLPYDRKLVPWAPSDNYRVLLGLG